MDYSQLSPSRFAAAIAERLDAVVPPGLSVRANGSTVNLYSGRAVRGGSVNAVLILEEDGRTLAELVETSACAILNDIQTDLMELLTEQWPLGERRQAAEPDARVTADRLLMWFGDEDKPLIALPPLELKDLVGGAA
jgi:hypothetical protein